MALNALTSFARQSARVTARPAWTGKPRRRRIVSDCRPVAVRAPLALDSPGRRAIGKRSAGDRPYASRPEMAPQVFGKARFAPGNGAPPGPSIRKPAACCLQFAVERPMRVARNSQGGPCGSRASPTDFVPRRRQVAFLIWTARNPLKSPESDEGIQRIQAHFLGPAWSGFGSAWRNLAGAFSGGSGPLIPEPAGVRHVAAFFIRRRPHRLYRRIPRGPRPRRADPAHSRLRLELSHQLGGSALGRDADPCRAAGHRLRQPRPRREPEALRPARLSLGRHGARRGESARPPEESSAQT